jgi:hypothetical protein
MGGLVYTVAPVVPNGADLVTSVSGPASATPGQYLNGALSLNVHNQGTSEVEGTETGNGRPNPNGYRVDLVLSTDTSVRPGFAIFSSTFAEDTLLKDGRLGHTTDLSPGQSLTVPMSVKIPIGTTPGNYFVCAQVDPIAVVREANENNNVTCYPIRIDPAIP